MSNLVPFGKYKNQPVEVLASDPGYVEWLLAQHDLKTRYPDFVNIIINNFQEPSETPEHNAIQVKFINEDYRLRFALCSRRMEIEELHEISLKVKSSIQKYADEKKFYSNDFFMPGDDNPKSSEEIEKENRENRENKYLELAERLKGIHLKVDSVGFEEGGTDVCFTSAIATMGDIECPDPDEDVMRLVMKNLSWHDHRVEIKPVVSDDFPAVLRQMRLSGANTLFLSKYTGAGATEQDFINYFKSQRIRVIFEHEVEKVKLPECLKIVF